MKYILSAATFIVGVFLFAAIHVLLNVKIGGILSYALAGLLFTAIGIVYKRSGQKKPGKSAGKPILIPVSKDDLNAFNKAFKGFDFDQNGIEEFIVANGNNGVSDFVIGIRTNASFKADYESLKAILHKQFYKNITFVFVNLNAMDKERTGIFDGGTEIIKRR
jgi:hypothetical protein